MTPVQYICDTSQPLGMPDHTPLGGPASGGPLRAPGAVCPAGIEAQAGDHEKDVIAPGVNTDPSSRSRLTVVAEALGWHRIVQTRSRLEDK